MKVFLTRSLTPIFLGVLLFTATDLYCQTTQTVEVPATAINKDRIVGKWKVGDTGYSFDKDGTSLVTIDQRECPGTWMLKGKILIINPKKLMYKKGDPCSKSHALQILSVNANDLHVFDKTKKKEFHLTKQTVLNAK